MNVSATRFSVFGQEFYYSESIRAIESFPDASEHDSLPPQIAEQLPHPSPATRLRIASKIFQRFFKDHGESIHFRRLVNHLTDETARRDLLYWRTARTDDIIAAIVKEILYPYFVMNGFPDGYDEATFGIANTATLFSIDKIISRDFVIRYARDTWGFESTRTVTLALRILKQARMLDAITVKLARRHVPGYYPQPHPVSPEVFAYCMYEEFAGDGPESPLSLDRIHNGDCARLFFMTRLQADSLLRSLEKKSIIDYSALSGGRHIRFVPPSLEALVDSITHGQ